MSELSERLKELRIKNNIPLKKLSDLLNLKNDRNYRNYESGLVDVSASKLIILANFYGVSVDYLLGRTNLPSLFTIKDELEIEEKINSFKNEADEAINKSNELIEDYRALAKFVNQHISDNLK